MKKFLLIPILFSLIFSRATAQELNCNLTVNSDKIPGSNKQVYQSMQRAMNEFVNNRRWTNMSFQQSEKIECSFVIIINEQADEKTFKASIQIQARRPIFNSSYYTPLFSFKDDNFNFEYIEHSPLEYTDGSFISNLTSMLAYYCYVIIGYDSDSFSRMGGTSHFRKAEAIVNLAQSQTEKGWRAFEDTRNRYALINNLLDDNLRKFREFYYDYHRLGLDEMSASVDKGRAKIASSMQTLRDVHRARPSSIVVTSFLEAKREEIISIFTKGTPAEKKMIHELLLEIDPSQSTQYDRILKN